MNFIGDKFELLGNDKYNRKVICKFLREDLKKEFLKPWKFTVAKDNYNSIIISIKKVPKEVVKDLNYKSYSLQPEHFGNEIFNKLEYIGNAYNYDSSEPQSDYFDRNYYLCWNLRDIEIV